ncbi:hypothetical protein [Ideonella sp.]|uniref:hypothetical protein n=1 Tax=Ideonella sp. TaxID=1929293 RepID=UPI003BB6D1E6
MLDSEKLAIAAHLHVIMRRKVGRVTDVEWMVKSPDYAREIIRVAMADPAHADLIDWAQRLRAALFPAPAVSKPARDAGAASTFGVPPSGFGDSRIERALSAAPAPRYVGSLR